MAGLPPPSLPEACSKGSANAANGTREAPHQGPRGGYFFLARFRWAKETAKARGLVPRSLAHGERQDYGEEDGVPFLAKLGTTLYEPLLPMTFTGVVLVLVGQAWPPRCESQCIS